MENKDDVNEEKGLPPELVEALKDKDSAQLKHNWMYSFMPGGESVVWLVAYCKVCDTGVSSRLMTDYKPGHAKITKMNIPKWGCIPVE